MAQNRIHYAVKQVGVAKCGENTFTAVHGAQSVGINTTFNLEQVFELSQLAIYENIENIPDVEVTIEKVLDGYPPVYLLATKDSTSPTLAGRSNAKATVGLSIYSDQQDSASGTPLAQCTMSGVYVSTVSYAVQTDGNATESVTLVGNNKVWNNTFSATTFNNTDAPLAAASGGVNRREDVLFGSNASLLPKDIPGISASGTNELETTGDKYRAAIQSIRLSCNLGREQLFELGRRGPYFRYITFPVEATAEFELISKEGDKKEALEDAASNLTDQAIRLKMREGLVVDLGTKNKLASVTTGGGTAGQGGGNETLTFSYTTFNDFTVQHPQDPTAALRP